MSDLPYMPLWVSKYDARTKHLSLEEDGAYLRLLRLCWATPGRTIPAQREWVRRQMRVDDATFDRVVQVVLDEFFKVRRGRYVNDKLCEIFVEQMEKSKGRKLKARKAGIASAQKRKERASTPSSLGTNSKSPYPEPEPDIWDGETRERDPELVSLEADCRKWANGSLVENFEGAGLSSIARLMQSEAGGELCTRDDVRVGITEAASSLHAKGKRVSSLEYFEQPILRARDKRLTPLPKVETPNERAGSGQSGGRGGHAAGNRGVRSGGQHRGNGILAGIALLQSLNQAPVGVPDGPEDRRNDRVA